MNITKCDVTRIIEKLNSTKEHLDKQYLATAKMEINSIINQMDVLLLMDKPEPTSEVIDKDGTLIRPGYEGSLYGSNSLNEHEKLIREFEKNSIWKRHNEVSRDRKVEQCVTRKWNNDPYRQNIASPNTNSGQ